MAFSKGELAERAGAEPAYVDHLLALGVFKPLTNGTFTSGDVRRVVLMKTLERSGLPLTEVAAAIRDKRLVLDLMDSEAYERFGMITGQTFAELSESTGVPMDLLMVIREAIGYAEPTPDDHVRETELQIVPLVRAQLELGFSSSTIERWLRVYGESVQRIVATEVDWWHSDVELPLIESGLSPSEMLNRAYREVTPRLSPLLDDVLIGLYHGHQEHSWTESIIFGVEAALKDAGVFSRLENPPAICFLDLTGYTRLTEQHGDQAAADTAAKLNRLVRRSAAKHQGKAIKWLGDGVMFLFQRAGPGIVSALEMVTEAEKSGLPPAHVGLHSGAVLFQQGDYFGATVNIASRISDYARPGEILVSQEALDEAKDVNLDFREIGLVELKGVTRPVRLHSAQRPADLGIR
jgi:adenylate cyclase